MLGFQNILALEKKRDTITDRRGGREGQISASHHSEGEEHPRFHDLGSDNCGKTQHEGRRGTSVEKGKPLFMECHSGERTRILGRIGLKRAERSSMTSPNLKGSDSCEKRDPTSSASQIGGECRSSRKVISPNIHKKKQSVVNMPKAESGLMPILQRGEEGEAGAPLLEKRFRCGVCPVSLEYTEKKEGNSKRGGIFP